MADWARNGSLAEYVAVEARNLAPLPVDVDHATAAALAIAGLTAWQGLFDHGHLAAGQTVLVHGVAGSVGALAAQLARDVGANVVGTGRAMDRERAAQLGAGTFVDLENERLEDIEQVDLVFDVPGGEILERSAALVRPGGTLVTITLPTDVRPADGRSIFFVVEPDRDRLSDLMRRVRNGSLEPAVGAVHPLPEAAVELRRGTRKRGKTIICPAS